MKTYISPRARVLPFCPESAILQNSKTVDISEDDVNGSDKSNQRQGIW